MVIDLSSAGHTRPNLFLLTLCLLAIGALFAWWMAARADRDLRANVLQQTRMVARAMDIEQIKTLTGTEADLKSPTYLRLKERLAAINSANSQSRFVYLMGRRADGVVFFSWIANQSVQRMNPLPGRFIMRSLLNI